MVPDHAARIHSMSKNYAICNAFSRKMLIFLRDIGLPLLYDMRISTPICIKSKKGVSMDTNIGLSNAHRHGVVAILTALLADEYVLYTKTRNYHWNVVGPQFNDLHKFFEEQYNELNTIVDEVAERARTLGENAIGTLAEFLERTRLAEQPGQYPPARDMLANLLADQENVIRQLRVDLETCAGTYQDIGTNDFLTGLMEQHEKMAWMLRAFLASAPV
jgi:starvation-inducible DNA-binding protein